jgi:hypothetical protein
VVDEGGIMEVDCNTKTAVEPVAPEYAWTITKPDTTTVSGTGASAVVLADQAGTYSCTFTASADRECPPPDITIGPETAVPFVAEITTPNGDPTTTAGANATNERTYSTSATPTVTVPCVAAGVPDPSKLRWSIDDVGAIQATWSPSVPGDPYTGTGLAPTATFAGMPPNYSDFGPKTITLTVEGLPNCQDTQVVEIFFPKNATNHPDPSVQDTAPGTARSWNFFFYWQQIPGLGNPNARFDENLTNFGATGFSFTQVLDGQGRLAGQMVTPDATFTVGPSCARPSPAVPLGDGVVGSAAGNPGVRGIDLLGATLIHEQHHLNTLGPPGVLDTDFDEIGDATEGPIAAAGDLPAIQIDVLPNPDANGVPQDVPGGEDIDTDPGDDNSDDFVNPSNNVNTQDGEDDSEELGYRQEFAYRQSIGSFDSADWSDPGRRHRTIGSDAD